MKKELFTTLLAGALASSMLIGCEGTTISKAVADSYEVTSTESSETTKTGEAADTDTVEAATEAAATDYFSANGLTITPTSDVTEVFQAEFSFSDAGEPIYTDEVAALQLPSCRELHKLCE